MLHNPYDDCPPARASIHGVHLDPTAADPQLLAHPLPPVRDPDPGAISGDDILSEELETPDPAEERGIIRLL